MTHVNANRIPSSHWQAASYQTWPPRTTPLTAYPKALLPLPSPLQQQQVLPPTNEIRLQLLGLPQQQFVPQYLAQNQFYLLNSQYYGSPFTLPLTVLPSPQVPQPEVVIATSTVQPRTRDIEPTTPRTIKKPSSVAASKLQVKTPVEADFKSDSRLLAAVRKINPEFVIEEIVSVPGKHVLSSTTLEPLKSSKRMQTAENPITISKLTPAKLKKVTNAAMVNSAVTVEATGKTATSGNIPEIPFGTYFLPYFAQGQVGGRKPASLILEPHSKAIVGNGGTAISTPISRAILKKGVPTNVYFNPESVAIAGVGGKAHAQADLELDLVN